MKKISVDWWSVILSLAAAFLVWSGALPPYSPADR
jgi:hypothetical protein